MEQTRIFTTIIIIKEEHQWEEELIPLAIILTTKVISLQTKNKTISHYYII